MTVTAANGAAPVDGAGGRRTGRVRSVHPGSMMSLLAERHLWRALRSCQRYVSEPGADGMTWRQLHREAPRVLHRLADELAGDTWRPGPARVVDAPANAAAGPRIVLPAVDQVVHMALRTAVEPVLDELALPDWAFGGRHRGSRVTALRRGAAHLTAGHRWIADLHVASVAEGVTIDEVSDWLCRYVPDSLLLGRLLTALTAMPSPIMCGSSLAPLLVNLRLSEVDRRLASLRVVRFVDNYAAFAPCLWQAQESFYAMSDALLPLRLLPNEVSSRIRVDTNVEDLFLTGG